MKPAMLMFLFLASHPVTAADPSRLHVNESGQANSQISETELSNADLARAQLWSLSATEWHRYRQLMQGIRGSISPPSISPIEVLGIHARDEAERRRYAETWARAMREDAGRILAFQQAYDAAGRRFYPDAPLIDVDRLPVKSLEADALQPTDRLLFFTRPACPICDLLLDRLLRRIDAVGGIDIYVTGLAPGDDAAVRDWASRHRIEPEWVRSRRVTLNHDGGALERLTNGQGETPYLLRRRGEALSPIRASEL
ncbi:MAG: TIGR03759 family integrating conjugative element protein [Gammaproteobacteria bacterium]|nr:TIGR03759 family integrating conjugative element protein [Gammaproteobacteria bacterium]